MPDADTPRVQLRFSGFVLDLGAGVLSREGGGEVTAQPLVLRLLQLLAERAGDVVPHEELGRHLWPDVHVTDASLSQAVRRLRTTLGAPDLVKTVPRRGYRLMADVTRVEVSEPPPRPTLRLPPDRFVGREAELADLRRRVAGEDRLITLVGPPGVGKTRLARTFAAERTGRVWFVELQAAADPGDLVREVARAVGARDGASALELGVLLAREPGLLVLDDFEQLTGAAEIVATWHRTAPDLVQLVTSRSVLGLRGERVVPVEPLPTADAVRLFADRADLPEDEPGVAELVEAVDRLPLAVELAAARARVLAPPELLAALQARFEVLRTTSAGVEGRHRSLRAALDDSWDLLSAAERRALTELAVFRGPFGLDDAAEVLWAGPALDRVQALVDRSLLRVDRPGRFALLPTIRAYAEERAAPEVRRAAEVRHGRWAARLGSSGSSDPNAWALPRERLDDLIAASRAAVARGDADVAGVTAVAAWRVLRRTGPVRLGLSLLEDADQIGSPADVSVTNLLGDALERVHRIDAAVEARLRARTVALERGDRATAAVAGIGAAGALRYLGRFAEAQQLLEEALPVFVEVGDQYHRALTHQILGAVLARAGEGASGLEQTEAAVALFRAQDVPLALASALENQGNDLATHGRYAEAEASYGEARALRERHGDRVGVARTLMNEATIHGERGDDERCAALSGEAARMMREIGRPFDEALALTNLAASLVNLGRLQQAEAAVHGALAIGRTLELRETLVPAQVVLARLRRVAGALREAAALVADAARMLDETHGDAMLVATVAVDGAEIDLALGHAGEALRRIGPSEAALRRGWDAVELTRMLAVKSHALATLGEVDDADAALAEAEGIAGRLGLLPTAAGLRRIAEARDALQRARGR